jgi:hypothetical protein
MEPSDLKGQGYASLAEPGGPSATGKKITAKP